MMTLTASPRPSSPFPPASPIPPFLTQKGSPCSLAGSDTSSSNARGILVPIPCAVSLRRFPPAVIGDGGSGCYRCEPRFAGWPDDSSGSGANADEGRRGGDAWPRRDGGGGGNGAGIGFAVNDIVIDNMAVDFAREKEVEEGGGCGGEGGAGTALAAGALAVLLGAALSSAATATAAPAPAATASAALDNGDISNDGGGGDVYLLGDRDTEYRLKGGGGGVGGGGRIVRGRIGGGDGGGGGVRSVSAGRSSATRRGGEHGRNIVNEPTTPSLRSSDGRERAGARRWSGDASAPRSGSRHRGGERLRGAVREGENGRTGRGGVREGGDGRGDGGGGSGGSGRGGVKGGGEAEGGTERETFGKGSVAAGAEDTMKIELFEKLPLSAMHELPTRQRLLEVRCPAAVAAVGVAATVSAGGGGGRWWWQLDRVDWCRGSGGCVGSGVSRVLCLVGVLGLFKGMFGGHRMRLEYLQMQSGGKVVSVYRCSCEPMVISMA